MRYHQLTEGQRYQIACLHDHGLSQAMIARKVGVHPSTISRELRRNRCAQGYQPAETHQSATLRRCSSSKYRVPEDTLIFVTMALAADWSPEQISSVCRRIGCPVSHEWIYRYVAQDKANGGKLFRHLRQGHKRYRKGQNAKRCVIPNPVSIDERPAIVDSRSRLGDWEVDTVSGKQGSGAIVTLAERKSRLYLVQYVPAKTAAAVADAIICMLEPYKAHVHTITADNGSEFVEHERVAKVLNAQFYFAHPYSAWERGLNENSNGLLRQYVPKGSDLSQLSPDELSAFERRLNLRPRKCLDFRQPQIVFDELRQVA